LSAIVAIFENFTDHSQGAQCLIAAGSVLKDFKGGEHDSSMPAARFI
jgi:hypothetical protein